jgi:hypothetical protein
MLVSEYIVILKAFWWWDVRTGMAPLLYPRPFVLAASLFSLQDLTSSKYFEAIPAWSHRITLKMATTVYAETLEHLQNATWSNPKCWSYTYPVMCLLLSVCTDTTQKIRNTCSPPTRQQQCHLPALCFHVVLQRVAAVMERMSLL